MYKDEICARKCESCKGSFIQTCHAAVFVALLEPFANDPLCPLLPIDVPQF